MENSSIRWMVTKRKGACCRNFNSLLKFLRSSLMQKKDCHWHNRKQLHWNLFLWFILFAEWRWAGYPRRWHHNYHFSRRGRLVDSRTEWTARICAWVLSGEALMNKVPFFWFCIPFQIKTFQCTFHYLSVQLNFALTTIWCQHFLKQQNPTCACWSSWLRSPTFFQL